MDFSTMRKKIEAHEYSSVGEFSADFQLIYENCLTYNARETVYYRAAVRLRDSGAPLLRFARKQVERAGIDSQTGMHTDELPENSLRMAAGQGELLPRDHRKAYAYVYGSMWVFVCLAVCLFVCLGCLSVSACVLIQLDASISGTDLFNI